MSGIVNKIKAKVEDITHKDKTHDTTTGTHSTTGVGHTGTTGTTHGTTGTTGGLTGSSTTHGTTGLGSSTTHGTTGVGSSNYGSDPTGPHDSHLTNKADPRVDSDRIGTAGNTSGAGGYGTGQYGSNTSTGLTGSNTHGTHGTTGLTGSNTHNTGLAGSKHSDPTGPHDSKLANKLDPRVDSDQYGAAGNTSGAGGYGTGQYGSNTGSGLTGSNTHGTHGTTGLAGSNTHTTGGLTGHSTTGHSTHGHNTTSGLGSSGYTDPSGPHDSHLANKADPRVDSDRYGAAGNTTGAGGIGGGQYTEGHHGTTGHSGIGGTTGTHGSTTGAYNDGVNTHGTVGKPSLKDKLNPKVDADGDGKAGFMK